MKNKGSGKKQINQKKLIIIFSALFLGIVVLFGTVMGIVIAVNNAGAVVNYNGTVIKEGVANYLASYCKYEYLAELAKKLPEVSDSDEFWEDIDPESGKSYGEILAERSKEYIKSVAVGAYLFDRKATVSSEDKNNIKEIANEVLAYQGAAGDIDKFNEIAEASGYDYSDFKKAVELIYKYKTAKSVMYGYNGQALSLGNNAEECEAFLSSYSHVYILFIRTESKYVTDQDTGTEVAEMLDDDERAEKQAFIDQVAEEIYNSKNMLEGNHINAERFFDFIEKEGDYSGKNLTKGYYFSSISEYTLQFASEGDGDKIVNAALSLEIGEYSDRIDIDDGIDSGVCFIYRAPNTAGAYADTSLDHFFSDFYENASSYLYYSELERCVLAVEDTELLLNMDFANIPKTEFIPRDWKQ